MSLAPTWAAVTASKRLPDGAQFTVDGGTLRIQFWSPEIVRVTFAPGTELPELKSLSVVAAPASVRLTRKENEQASTLATPRVKVTIDKQTGAVSFLDSADHVLLRETADGRKFQPATIAGDSVTSYAQVETASDEELSFDPGPLRLYCTLRVAFQPPDADAGARFDVSQGYQ